MKKIKIITITAIIYIGLILINTKVYAASTGKTINETTRMREKASTSSSTVTLISINQEVEIISEEGEWYKVKYTSNGKIYSGYIRNDMLKTDKKQEIKKEETEINNEVEKDENIVKSTKSEESVENVQTIEVKEGIKASTKSKINVRILPLINSNKVGNIEKNSSITIVEILGNWAYVESNEQSGWVIKNELKDSISVETSKKEENKKPEEIKKEEPKKEETDKKETVEKKEEVTEKDNKTENKQEERTLYVSSQTVNLRKEANSTSTILKQLSRNTKVTEIEKVNNIWSKVKVDGITGYMSSTYLSEKKTEVTSRGSEKSREEKEKEESKKEEDKKTETTKKEENKNTETIKKEEPKKEENKKPETTKKEEPKKEENKKNETEKKEETKKEDSKESSKVTGSDIVAHAKKYLGYKYILGAASPKRGFDCSGLVYYVYGQNGYSLNRTSSAQASNGKKVSKSNLKAGDLVFFSQGSKKIGHVGIYIGGGNFIHAANPKKGVVITSLSNSYYLKNYVTARRIIN